VTGGTGAATAASPGAIGFSIDPTQAALLQTGAYYGTISVIASGVVNSPQDFQVILNVAAATSHAVPDPEPAGLIFISSAPGALPPQVVQLFASSVPAIPYQASATVDSGSWLSISPATGTASASAPGQITATADPGGLKPGVYRGTISLALGPSTVRTVNVTLIVQSAAGQSAVGAQLSSSSAKPGIATRPAAASSCAAGTLVATQTGLVSNFSAPASWPTPLAIKLFDSCGNPISNGQIVASFTNGDPPLILSNISPTAGLYSATWTPRKPSAQVTISASASAPGYPPSAVKLAGQVAPNSAPSLAPNGTQDIFYPQVGGGLGPGNIVQIYGSGLASQIQTPGSLPLPTILNGSSVLIGGVEAPLFYVSPGQINAQIPAELDANKQYQVIVNANGALTTPQPIQLTNAVPSILEFSSGAVVAQHLDGTLIGDSSPAAQGEYVVIYLSGMGATDIPVPSGTAAPTSPLANVVDVPIATLNGNPVKLVFAGLTPGLVGLYQINFQIPQDLADGNYSLVISQDGSPSNTTTLPVAANP
jgi:uncharacterized protein (TIGR03437 family)